MSNQVKILFRFYSAVLDEWTVETMWAEIVDAEKGHYKLDGIPFYVPLVASDDVIRAAYDDAELMLHQHHAILLPQPGGGAGRAGKCRRALKSRHYTQNTRLERIMKEWLPAGKIEELKQLFMPTPPPMKKDYSLPLVNVSHILTPSF